MPEPGQQSSLLPENGGLNIRNWHPTNYDQVRLPFHEKPPPIEVTEEKFATAQAEMFRLLENIDPNPDKKMPARLGSQLAKAYCRAYMAGGLDLSPKRIREFYEETERIFFEKTNGEYLDGYMGEWIAAQTLCDLKFDTYFPTIAQDTQRGVDWWVTRTKSHHYKVIALQVMLFPFSLDAYMDLRQLVYPINTADQLNNLTDYVLQRDHITSRSSRRADQAKGKIKEDFYKMNRFPKELDFDRACLIVPSHRGESQAWVTRNQLYDPKIGYVHSDLIRLIRDSVFKYIYLEEPPKYL